MYLLELLRRLKDNETALFTTETNDVEFALVEKLFQKLIELGIVDPSSLWVLESGTHRRQHQEDDEPIWADCRLSAHAERLLEENPEGLRPAQLKQIRQYVADSREGRAVNIDESVTLRACLAWKRPKIIFATVGMAMRNHTRLQRIVTHACIDEAGHSTEMEIISLLCMFDQIRSLFLTGDPKQARDDAISHPDAVQRHSFYPITDVLKARGVPTVTLKTCYRMKQALMDAVSFSSYDGKLRCGVRDQDRAMFDRMPANVPKEVPVLVFNSDDAGVLTMTKSRHNPAQTSGVLHAAEYLRHHYPEASIAIICYYGSQAKILRQQTRHLNVTCVTVDGFVGKESDFVIACVSRSVPTGEQPNPLQFGFVLNNNRATVVQSRAREGLILVGQVRLIRAGERWLKYLQKVEAKSPFHELAELQNVLSWSQ
ncbi:helicase with zinc finger domain [Aphelenchoides avenae]|nr:helicase with zinc finger domain [Aphelenchus avenae]